MRIAFISSCRKESTGGHVRVAQELARAFARRHDVLLIYPDDETRLIGESDRLAVFEMRSIGEGDVVFPGLFPEDLRQLSEVLAAFGPDIVHSHDIPMLSWLGQIWANRHGTPYVHTLHLLADHYLDFGAREVTALFDNRVGEQLTDLTLRRFLSACDAVITPNAAGAESCRRVGYTGSVFVIPNGRDLAQYATSGPADVTAPRKILTFVGWISHRKNQRYLLEALSHLPRHYELRIIGGVLDPAYRAQLDGYVRDHDLQNVTFTGPVENDRIRGYLAQTHVFVSASTMEVQSLALLEALASGTPVVGLSNETVDEFVDDAVGSRLPADASPAQLAQAIMAVCEQPQAAYDEACRQARARVQRLDWSSVVGWTCEAYREIIADRQQRDPAAGQPGRNAGTSDGHGRVSGSRWLLAAGMIAASSAAFTLTRRGQRSNGSRKRTRAPLPPKGDV